MSVRADSLADPALSRGEPGLALTFIVVERPATAPRVATSTAAGRSVDSGPRTSAGCVGIGAMKQARGSHVHGLEDSHRDTRTRPGACRKLSGSHRGRTPAAGLSIGGPRATLGVDPPPHTASWGRPSV
jgi:hypothetical protein